MYKRIDLTKLEGIDLSQDLLDFMQSSYREAVGAFAQMIGDLVIVAGVDDLGDNYGNGWVAINGELLPFVGGVKAANVIIEETIGTESFGDGGTNDVYFTRIAKTASLGGNPIANFLRLSSLKATQEALASEITNRTNGDIEESVARLAADTALQNQINEIVADTYDSGEVVTASGGGNTDILLIPTVAGKNYMVEVDLSSRQTAGGDPAGSGGYAKKIASFKNVGGVLTLSGAVETLYSVVTSASSPVLSLVVSGTNIIARVATGSATVFSVRVKAKLLVI